MPSEGEIKRIIEALVFASEKPLPINEIKDVLEDVDSRKIRTFLEELKEEYQQHNHSFRLAEVAGGFQFYTDPAYANWLKKLYKTRHAERLTSPGMETLAIVAYRQPITRAEIEAIRGVNVDGVVKTLLDRKLIKILGRKEVIGRPIIYGTTQKFLEYFGLSDTAQLPKLEEFTEKDLSQEESVELLHKGAAELQDLEKESKTEEGHYEESKETSQ